MRIVTLAAILGTLVQPALAQDDPQGPYVDDRSSPQALVRSLYNAINRKEYGRAWSYFSEPPAANVEAYGKGYASTESVELVVGTPAEEGAAGSIYYVLPVAIAARGTDGAPPRIFSGCYTMRLANPQVQVEAFQPLRIEKGRLAPAVGRLENALPASCPDGPELPPQNASVEKARAKFAASRSDDCDGMNDEQPQTYDIEFRYASSSQDEPPSTRTLIRFFCGRGAYNEKHVYYMADELGAVSEVHFAEPQLDIHYKDDESAELDSMNVIGFKTQDGLINSDYDPKTMTITAWAKWRGVGDASSSGTWAFREGDFALVKFEVDPTYDGEIEHTTVVDYDTGP